MKTTELIKVPIQTVTVTDNGEVVLNATTGANVDPFAYRRAKLKGQKNKMRKMEQQKTYRVFNPETNEYL